MDQLQQQGFMCKPGICYLSGDIDGAWYNVYLSVVPYGLVQPKSAVKHTHCQRVNSQLLPEALTLVNI